MFKRIALIMTCLVFCLSTLTIAVAENSCPLLGEWVYPYDPDTIVLRVSEDGSAWYGGVDYTWVDQEGFLLLTDENGDSLPLRYLITEDQKIIYPHTEYARSSNVDGQGGLIGVWQGVHDGSSFVFTPAGYFLEDNSFSGNFMMDAEKGTFLLHYGDLFADTLCYYSVSEDEILTVEYPWEITSAEL